MTTRSPFLAIGATRDSARDQILALGPSTPGLSPSIGDGLVWDGTAWVPTSSTEVYPHRIGLTAISVTNGDYVSIANNAAFQQTQRFAFAFKIYVGLNSAPARNLTPILAQWNWATGVSRLFCSLSPARAGGNTGLYFFLGDGTTNGTGFSAATATGLLPSDVETEVLVSIDLTAATNALKFRVFNRTLGGTWSEQTMSFPGGSMPASVPATTLPLVLGYVPGFNAATGNGEFFDGSIWDVRWFRAPILPAVKYDLPLTLCTMRHRFLNLSGATSTDEIGGTVATLIQAQGGPTPVGYLDGWFVPAPRPGAKKILGAGNSKMYGTNYPRGGFREETSQRIAITCDVPFTWVGRYVDATPVEGFAPHAYHTGLGGASLPTIQAMLLADMQSFAPDVILVEGGTNDALAGQTGAQILTRWTALLNAVFLAQPSICVVVMIDPLNFATINPNPSAAELLAQSIYNAGLPSLVDGFAASGRNIRIAGPYALREQETDFGGYHERDMGYRRMALTLAPVMKAALESL